MKNGFERPVNRTAAKVVARGESFEYRRFEECIDSDLPLPIREIPEATRNSPDFRDLTGLKVMRLTVIGLSADRKRSWVCRCICGNFTRRTTKFLLSNHELINAACNQCMLLAKSKAADYRRRTGRGIEAVTFL